MPQILIVEDDPISMSILTEIVQSMGHTAQQAADAFEAEILFRANPPDLLLTDMYMPGKEALEMLKQLRFEFPDMKVVVFSGGNPASHTSTLQFAKNYGALATFTKPFDRAEVQKKITAALQA